MSEMNASLMKALIVRQYPGWDDAYAQRYADQHLAELDPRLKALLYTYATTGKTSNFSYSHGAETFSVLEIQAMRRCSYLDAVLLLNNYIHDPLSGRARIMRR